MVTNLAQAVILSYLEPYKNILLILLISFIFQNKAKSISSKYKYDYMFPQSHSYLKLFSVFHWSKDQENRNSL